MVKYVDNREVTKAVIASIVVTPNNISSEIIGDKEVITYFTTILIRYSLQDATGHLVFKNVHHKSSHTSEPLDDTEIVVIMGDARKYIKADKLLLSNVDIG